MTDKSRITVLHGVREETVSWYPGTTSYDIERLVRQIFNLPNDVQPMLRDLQGDNVVIHPNLPSGRTFTLTTIPRDASHSLSASMISSPRSPAGIASPSRRSAALSPARSANLSASYYSPRPLGTPSRMGSANTSYSLAPVAGNTSISSPRSPGASLAKQVLDRVDKLRAFERRVRDLRHQKLDDFFQLSLGEWIWRRDVSLNDFMQALSSDLYWNAGACGLLSSSRRGEVDRILNAALGAYLDYVRELGRRGNFEPIVSVKAQYAREALMAAYDAVQRLVNEIIGERLREAETYSAAAI